MSVNHNMLCADQLDQPLDVVVTVKRGVVAGLIRSHGSFPGGDPMRAASSAGSSQFRENSSSGNSESAETFAIPHFTPDQAAAVFDDGFLDLGACREWIFAQIHREHGARCPFCGLTVRPGKANLTFWTGGRVCCPGCKKYFTARTGTILAGTDLEDATIFCLAVLIGFGLDDRAVSVRLGIDRGTVRAWREKLTAP